MSRVMLFLMITIAAHSFADEAVQTDWSGGDGISGPVFDWGDAFDDADSINWQGEAGVLQLALTSITSREYEVGEGLYAAYYGEPFDIDGDGDMDVLGSGFNTLTWWENEDGAGTVWDEHLVTDTTFYSLSCTMTDVDNDGDLDIIAPDCNNDLYWFENENGYGTDWEKHTIDSSIGMPSFVATGNINGDGYTDVVGVSYADNEVIWWQNLSGGSAWYERTVATSFTYPVGCCVSDIDGDGDLDILATSGADDDVIWWENEDGSGTTWDEHLIDGEFDGAYSCVIADINGDGYLDVLATASVGDELTWWENENGTGTDWDEHQISDGYEGYYSCFAQDMNNNGYVDVAATLQSDNTIVWWENTDGTGLFWNEYVVTTDLTDARFCAAGDISGSGFPDIVGTSCDYGLFWYDVVGYTEEGWLESSILEIALPTDDVIEWGTLTWSSAEPGPSNISVQVRGSDNPGSMGTWYPEFTSSGGDIGTYLSETDYFFQYRVCMASPVSVLSPILFDITASYDLTGGIAESGTASAGYSLLPVTPNPAPGNISVDFILPETIAVEFTLFDMSGRIVESISLAEIEAGSHSILLDGLNTGTYILQMKAGIFEANERVVVLK